jgi:nitronate monooxygenase
MWKDQRLCELLEIEHPIIQAPMAGASTPEMAVAAANAGGMGSLGCATMTVDQVGSDMHRIRQDTNRAINLNFFVHTPPRENSARALAAAGRLASWYEKFDAGDMPDAVVTHYPFDAEMCDAMVQLCPKVVSFHFGLPDAGIMTDLKSAGITILSSATSVAEARYLEENGVDAIIAQGYEAGGHSGHFLPRGTAEVAGTMALVPRIVDAVSLPVIAAGGIADGRGIAAALMLGAAGVQIGTAFLATPESAASDTHKRALLKASGDETMLSPAFSGRHARTLVNKYATEMDDVQDWPDFPVMNTLTGPIRKASAKAGSEDAIALWSGQAVGLIRAASTTEVFNDLVTQTNEALTSLT